MLDIILAYFVQMRESTGQQKMQCKRTKALYSAHVHTNPSNLT